MAQILKNTNFVKSILTIFMIFISFKNIMLIRKSTICGKFVEEYTVKGSNYLRFKFKVKGISYYCNVSSIDFQFKEIKNRNCIKIEYSEIWPHINQLEK